MSTAAENVLLEIPAYFSPEAFFDDRARKT